MAAGLANEWDPYFDRKSERLVESQSLKDQVAEVAEDVFGEKTEFSIHDIRNGEVETSVVTNEAEWERAAGKTPKAGVRVISIYSDRTIAALRISSRLASKILQKYQVKRDFLRVLLSFGGDPHKSEASSAYEAFYDDAGALESYVALYKLNYVEQNKRSGKDPWSSRHVGMYHHHNYAQGLDIFIMIHCTRSTAFYRRLDALLLPPATEAQKAALRDLERQPANMHSLLLSCYVENWRAYLRHVGVRFSKINNKAMVEDSQRIGQESFRRVQSLRNTHDITLFAGACCANNLTIVTWLSKSTTFESQTLQSLSAQANALRGCIESAKVLEDRIQNAIDLVGYTLTLHNQQETAKLDKEIRDMTQEMKNLAQETSVVTKKLKELTQNTVDDSAIVSIITIVSAIYIPGSFAGTIFGMNFFEFDAEARKIAITGDIWIFILVWVVLMLLTGTVFLLTYSRKNGLRAFWKRGGASKV